MKKIKEFLKKSVLFEGLSDVELEQVMTFLDLKVRSVSRGEKIIFRDEGELVFVLSGRLDVLTEKSEGGFTVLNRLKEGDTFGLLSVFSPEKFPTTVVASLNSQILTLDKEKLLKIIDIQPKISKNIIYFMADRINFLNKKISTVCGTRVDDRLFSYLLAKAKNEGNGVFSLNCKKCSEAINAGRASVYRAIELLVNEGVILYENKKITLLKNERK